VHSRKVSGSDPAPALSGQISRVSIGDLLSTLEGRGRSAVVRFETPAGSASVWFANGRLVDAEMGVLSGEAALYRILGLQQGTFQVSSEAVQRPRVIQDPVSALVAKRSKRAARWEDLVFGGPALDGVPRRPAVRPPEPESADDRRLLRLVDDRRTLLEILDESRLDPVQALEAFARLTRDGHVVTDGSTSSRPPPPRPEPSPPREGRISRPDPAEFTPPRSATLKGIAAQKNAPPSDPPPISASERQLGSTLIGPADPSWLQPPSPRTPSSPPESGPSVVVESGVVESVPQESGLSDVQVRLERERQAKQKSARDSWPSVEVSSERASVPPGDESHAEDATRPSVAPSLPPTSRSSGLAIPGAIVGPYQVLFRLASGSSSSVYLCREAEHGSVRSLFALKVFEPRPEFQGSLDGFSAAAQETAALSHPNIARLLGTGTSDGRPLLVSTYIEGCSLGALLKRHPTSRPLSLMLAVMFDALRGLQAAHELTDDSMPVGLFHGDLCPRDLLIGLDGVGRVSDLAASHALRRVGVRDPSREPAKRQYLSPERLLGKPLDERSDVFSMGVILYEMLTCTEPFAAASAEEVQRRVLEQPVEAPSKVGVKPPKAFDDICRRALEREPERRFQSVRELLMALEEAALEQGTLASSVEVASWIGSAFGRELELRRLSILDASRRARRGNRPVSTVPPPVSAPVEGTAGVVSAELPSPQVAAIVPWRDPSSPPPAAIVPLREVATLSVSTLPDIDEASIPMVGRGRVLPALAISGVVLAVASAAFWLGGRSEAAVEPAEPAAVAPAPGDPAPTNAQTPHVEPAAPSPAAAEPAITAVGDASSAPPAVESERAPRRPRSAVARPGARQLPGEALEPSPPPAEPPAPPPVAAPPPQDEAPAPAPAPSAPPAPPRDAPDPEFRYGI